MVDDLGIASRFDNSDTPVVVVAADVLLHDLDPLEDPGIANLDMVVAAVDSHTAGTVVAVVGGLHGLDPHL